VQLRGSSEKHIATIIQLAHTNNNWSLSKCFKVAYGDGRIRWVESKAIEILE
jgi:hypothetical protein